VPDLGVYKDTDWPAPQKGHAAMISRMDADVGRLFDRLKELGIDEKTVVFFSSDNGPHKEGGNDPAFNRSSGPLRGIKRDLTEGGIRVPFLVRWPGTVKAGLVSDHVGAFWDLLPTLAELGGATVPPGLDGLSIVPTLIGKAEQQKQHAALYWAFYERGGGQALRTGRWKAVQQPMSTPVRLYDLEADLGEKTDLAGKHPDVVADVKKRMQESYTPSERWRFPMPTKP
jgi:arylsulfatase A-like enzyme